MCGIFLAISKKKLNKKKCINSETLIKSRGPDITNNSFFFNKKVFLANTILSISGKKNDKKKLQQSKSKRYVLSFNGEVYNWRQLAEIYNLTESRNDSQLLINLFDKIDSNKIPGKINGMFTYCVIDKKRKKVYFSSDVQGEKKLFLFQNDDNFVLSSNINAIINYIEKDSLNIDQIKNYFNSRHFIYETDTIFNNIKVIPPGHTFCLNIENLRLKKKIYDNPLNWISKSAYLKNKKKSFSLFKFHLKEKLERQAKLMIPDTKFGCILTGGIDSAVQTAILRKFKVPFEIAGLNYLGKDKVAQNVNKFSDFFSFNVKRLDITKKRYLKDFKKCYKIFGSPFLTHHFVGSHQISKYFKKNGNKVMFGADGLDEMMGGYELYKKIKWISGKNCSPYSHVSINGKLKKKIDKMWSSAFQKYKKFSSIKEATIQASFFTDYFIQAVYVSNIGADIMCSSNGIETRNIFIQKKVITEFLNTPLKYKINFKSKKKKFILKPILKRIFADHFPEKLISNQKQGFSGFPNESRVFLKKNQYKHLSKIINLNSIKKSHAMEWKMLNLEFFLKIFKNKIIF